MFEGEAVFFATTLKDIACFQQGVNLYLVGLDSTEPKQLKL